MVARVEYFRMRLCKQVEVDMRVSIPRRDGMYNVAQITLTVRSELDWMGVEGDID